MTEYNDRGDARKNLSEAAARLNAIPKGVVNTQEVIARCSQAQAAATVAVAQALLDLADAVREAAR
jgi:hypothetical protein